MPATQEIKLEKQFDVEIKSSKDGAWIEGYAAIFEEVDQDKDRIFPGSFKRSIDNQIKQGKVLLLSRHIASGGNVSESIGVIKEAYEDSKGFYIKAKVFDTAAAKDVRAQIIEAPDAFGMSIGWKQTVNNRVENDFGGWDYSEINLKEVTITIIPAQQGTIGTLKAKEVNSELKDINEKMQELIKENEELKAKNEEIDKKLKEIFDSISSNDKSIDKSDKNSVNPSVSKGLKDLVSAKNRKILQQLIKGE